MKDTKALLPLAAIAGLLASCGAGTGAGPARDDATKAAVTSPAPTSSEGSAQMSSPGIRSPALAHRNRASAWGTGSRVRRNSGEWDLILTDVRVAERDTYARIVLEFNGTGTPGWSVNYVVEPVADGSGDALPLGGDTFLDIYASGTAAPLAPGGGLDPEGGYYDGPQHFQPANGGAIGDVFVGGWFEGYTQVTLGIDGHQAPFRVVALTDPPRLVVDLAHDTNQ